MPSPNYSMKYILDNFKRNALLPDFLKTDFIRRHTLNIACEHNLLEVTNIIDIHPHFSTRGLCFRLKNV